MDDLIAIDNCELSAAIHPLGAELWSLRDADGRQLMTDADPAFWTGHAPLLFPIVGRLRNDRYRLKGQDYPLPQHGFARRRPFTLVEHGAARALFRLEADAETRAVYPFDFRLDMIFSLESAALHMEAVVSNRDDADMPFSLGYHPAFAWPLPYGAAPEDHCIVFETDEPGAIRRIGGEPGLISPETMPTPVSGRELRPTRAMFEADALIWDHLSSRSLRWGPAQGTRLRIDFPDTPMLGLWQKPGARYLCIEPWAGIADPAGFEGDIWHKPGIMRLAPGQARSFRMTVTLEQN